MPARRVHQILGALHAGDAVGNEARTIRRHLRDAGFDSEIFAGRVDPVLGAEARRLAECGAAGGDGSIWLYHFAPGSPATACALAVRGPLVLVYHNVTPARFFAGFSDEMVSLASRRDPELRALAGRARLALAKSAFSLKDLEQAGFGRCAVMPFIHDLGPRPSPSPVLRRLFGDGRTNLLSVGRLAPNKRLEGLLTAFAVLQRGLLPRCRLLLAGQRSVPAYVSFLEETVRRLRLADVVFLGHVDDAELQACYEAAHVYVSLSEHEGYGVPLVEALLAGVPVLARDAGATSETLAGAGILVSEPDPARVAGLVERLVRDHALRARVLEGQARAAEAVRRTDFAAALRASLEPVWEGA